MECNALNSRNVPKSLNAVLVLQPKLKYLWDRVRIFELGFLFEEAKGIKGGELFLDKQKFFFVVVVPLRVWLEL